MKNPLVSAVRLVLFAMLLLVRLSAAAPVSISTVDSGTFSSQAVVAGKPGIAYSSASTLKFARNAAADGSGAWTSVTVDSGGGGYASLAIVAGKPAIAYYKASHLYFARASTVDGMGSWTTVLVDGAINVGAVPSLVVAGGNPAISYEDSFNRDLKYARASTPDGAGAWSLLTVDSVGDVGLYTSMAIVAGRPAIAYKDWTNNDLKYARATDSIGSGWILTTVHSTGNVGEAPWLAVVDGAPAIAYFDWTTPAVRYARNSSADGSGSWSIVTAVAGGAFPGSLAVVNGRPAITYRSGTNLKYVRAADAAGTIWGIPLTVDAATPGMDWYSPLTIAGGRPAISYSDFTSHELRWAKIGLLPGDADELDAAIVGDYIVSTAVQPDGKTLIAGRFSSVLGVARNNLARLNADGTLDLGFNPALAGYEVSCLAVLADGKIMVGGNMSVSHLVRLNPDGTLDPGFSHSPGGTLVCMAVQPNGKILVGGNFISIDGFYRAYIARFNADGSHDHTFVAATDQTVFTMAVQPDGKILIGGPFSAVNSSYRDRIARLNEDGTVDFAFNPGVIGNYVANISLQADGKILLAGDFTAVGGVPRANIARLEGDPAGTVDAVFDPMTSGEVKGMVVQTNGDIVLGGVFASVRSSGGGAYLGRSRIARLNAAGVLDPTFNPGANDAVYTLAAQADGRILAGGIFTKMDGLARNRFARLANDPATQDLSVPGVDYVQWLRGGSSSEAQYVTFELSTDGGATYSFLGNGSRLYGGWNLTGLSLPREGMVRARARTLGGFSGSTGLVEAVKSYRSPVEDLDLAVDGIVFATAEQPDGKTVIAGNFTTVLGTARNNIARFNADGTLDLTFDPKTNGQVACVMVQADGKIVIGGGFTSLQPNGAAASTTRLKIARLNPDGTLDLSFHPDVIGSVTSMAIQADGEILFVGEFTSVAGVSRRNVARLHGDGSLDTGFDPSADYEVRTVALQPDGKILLGGRFTSLKPNGAASPTPRQGIARVNTDGSLDAVFTGSGITVAYDVFSIAVQPDGKVLVSGILYNPVRGYGIYAVRLNADATGSLDSGYFVPPVGAYIYSMALQADGKILHQESSMTRLGRVKPDGTSDPGFGTGVDSQIYSIAMQASGKVLLGGSFGHVGGVPRVGFAQLENSPAIQTLTVPSLGRVEWLRGGTSPESLDVTFEISTDGGVSYAMLGTGIRIPGGWEISGLSLPLYGQVRARARTISGFFNGSSGIVENTQTYGTPPGIPDDLDLAIAGLRVWAIAVQPDGKTVIGGEFTSVLGVPRNNIARFNGDGSLDLTFDPNVTGGGGVYGLVIQPDGNVVLGGYFTGVGGVFRLHLARVHGDGSLDTSYAPHPDNPVYCMAACPDGKLLIGGAFSAVGGAARGHLARLEVTGGADPGFIAPTPNNYVTSLALQADGNLVFGGYFSAVGGVSRNLVARVTSTGSLDGTFDPNVTGSGVYALAVQVDGGIVLGGVFSNVGGVARSHLARVHPDGTPDLAFNPNPNNLIFGATVQADGRILISGGFSSLQPGAVGPVITRHNIARLTTGGNVDSTFDPDANGFVNGATLQADGKVMIGGEFTTVGGVSRSYFARLSNLPATQYLTNFGHGRVQWLRGDSSPESHAVSFELSTDGGLTYTLLGQGTRVPGGWELTGLSLPDSGLLRARARTLGGLWGGSGGLVETVAAVRPPLDGFDAAIVGGWVNATTMQPDGAVIIAGEFTSVLGVARRNVARIKTDGTLDLSFDPSPNAIVNCVAVQADGKILLGGNFNQVQPNGASTPIVMAHLVRLNPDGTVDLSFVGSGFFPNPDAHVDCIAIQPDGKILLGGAFNYIGGGYHHGLARLDEDGVADSFDAGITAGTLVEVTCMVLQPDGKIVLGGYFDAVGGQPRNHLARVESDGSLDLAFDPNPDGYIASLALQRDGKIVVGGLYSSMGGTTRRNLARLHPTGLLDSTCDPRPNGTVWSLAMQTDGKILLGGAFTELEPGGAGLLIPRSHLARLKGDGTADPDFYSPATDGVVGCVALKPDGKLWLGGGFTTVDGSARRSLALLTNSPAAASLTKSGVSRLDWSRGGAAPEVSDVTFELSTDLGVTYTLLGHATRTVYGWTRSGLSLPSSGLVRARARTQGCSAGGSSGLVETVLSLGPPVLDPYDEWIAVSMPTSSAADRLFTADPDHDGLANGIEFYFGLSPSAPSVVALNPVATTSGITLTYTRATGLGAMDATAVQWGTDLENWSTNGVITTVLGLADTTHETVQVTIQHSGDRIFVRCVAHD